MTRSDGWKRACAVLLLCTATAITSSAKSFTILVNFNASNGSQSEGSLVQGPDGNLYGTTFSGGPNNGCGVALKSGCGTVFEVTPDGLLTTLYRFCAQQNCVDGYQPVGALTLGTDGNFYGITFSGTDSGYSTVFKITLDGRLTTLHNFCRDTCADGSQAMGPLVEGPDGNFYGTTGAGGVFNSQCPSGCGTVFRITPAGSLTTLYSFMGLADGGIPPGGLLLASDGNFYGTSDQGGTINNFQCPSGCGTVFKITTKGVLTTLFSFNEMDGHFPVAPVVQATDGHFYGTTTNGGTGSGSSGTVFKITPGGSLKTLYSFCTLYGCSDGSNPTAELVQATDGNFYGTTSGAGTLDSIPGTVFRITPGGRLATLHTFCARANCADGYAPVAGLLQATDGNFYGTAVGGGPSTNCGGGCGTLFRLSLGLRPFVKTIPTAAKAGAQVAILGNGLTGTTGVTFNGTAAAFTVVSDTEITASVPTGATTGTVQVTGPGGTLASNVPFRVTH